ncbi:hypothetical protein AUP68_02027 [Ilyonectria robusta]
MSFTTVGQCPTLAFCAPIHPPWLHPEEATPKNQTSLSEARRQCPHPEPKPQLFSIGGPRKEACLNPPFLLLREQSNLTKRACDEVWMGGLVSLQFAPDVHLAMSCA